MLVDLDHPQPAIEILVYQSFDAGGLSGAGVAVEQHVVGVLSRQKGLGVAAELLLLLFVAQQVLQHHAVHIGDGQKLKLLSAALDAEGPVHGEKAHAVLAVVGGHQGKDILPVPGAGQGAA